MSHAPPSRRPQAQLHHLREMGTVVISGECAVVAHRMGDRTRWRRQTGTDWFERVDEGAPIAPDRFVAHADPRERESFFNP